MRTEELTESRILLLQELSRNPYLSNKDLIKIAGFKDRTYPTIAKRELTKQGYLAENNFEIDYGKLCKNEIDILYAFIVFDCDDKYLQNILRNIGSYRESFSLVEICFSSYLVSFYSDDNKKIQEILDYLVNRGIVYSYIIYKRHHKCYWRHPVFIKDNGKTASSIPSFDNLLKDREIPDLNFGKYEERLSFMDLRIIDHFQAGNLNCNLKKIQKYEKEHGNLFSYFKLKESLRELTKRGIIEKKPYIFPFPSRECYKFVLCLRANTFENTQRIIFNLGEQTRIFEKITYVSSPDNKKKFGFLECVTSPVFFIKLMRNLDVYNEIVEKRVYVIKNYSKSLPTKNIPLEYYDLKTQELHFPFDEFFQDIKRMIEGDKNKRVLDKRQSLKEVLSKKNKKKVFRRHTGV
jgi:hypothetical protein